MHTCKVLQDIEKFMLFMKKVLIILLILIVGSVLTLKFVSRTYFDSDTIMGKIANILNRNNKIDLSCEGIDRDDIRARTD